MILSVAVDADLQTLVSSLPVILFPAYSMRGVNRRRQAKEANLMESRAVVMMSSHPTNDSNNQLLQPERRKTTLPPPHRLPKQTLNV
jgi:hypothetical protein